MPNQLYQRGKHRDEYDGEDNQREVVLDCRDAPESITQGDAEAHPERGGSNAEDEKARVGHRPNSRHEGGKGADNGHEPRENDRLAAVPLEECVGTIEMSPIEKPRVFVSEQAGSE